MSYLKINWKWGIVEGIVLILCGWIALARPILTSFSLALVVGALLVASGLATGYRTLKGREEIGYWPSLIGSLLLVIVGGLMMVFPTGGVLTLAGMITAFFTLQGLLQLALAWTLREDGRAWGLFLFNGLLSLGMAVIVWLGWPSTAVWFIGLLFGIHLIFAGTTVLVLSWHSRKA